MSPRMTLYTLLFMYQSQLFLLLLKKHVPIKHFLYIQKTNSTLT